VVVVDEEGPTEDDSVVEEATVEDPAVDVGDVDVVDDVGVILEESVAEDEAAMIRSAVRDKA